MAAYGSALFANQSNASAWTNLPGEAMSCFSSLEPSLSHQNLFAQAPVVNEDLQAGAEELAEFVAQSCIEEEPLAPAPQAPIPRSAWSPPQSVPLSSASAWPLQQLTSSLPQDVSPLFSLNSSRSLSCSSNEGSFVDSPTSVLRRNGGDAWDLLSAAAGRVQAFDCSSSFSSSSPSTSASGSPSVSPPRQTPARAPAEQCLGSDAYGRTPKVVTHRRRVQRQKPQQQRTVNYDDLPNSGGLTGTGVFHPAGAQAQKAPQRKVVGPKTPTQGANSKPRAGSHVSNPNPAPRKAPRPAPTVYIPERLVVALGLNVDSDNNIVVNRPVPAGAPRMPVQGRTGCAGAKDGRQLPVMKLVKDDVTDAAGCQKKHGGAKGARQATLNKKQVGCGRPVKGANHTVSAIAPDELNLPSDWVY